MIVTLADSNQVSKSQFKELPKAIQEIGLTQGLEAMNRALDLTSKFQQVMNQLAVKAEEEGPDAESVAAAVVSPEGIPVAVDAYGGLRFKSIEDSIGRGDIGAIIKALEGTKWAEFGDLLKSMSPASAISLMLDLLQSSREHMQVVAQEKQFKQENIELGDSGQWVSRSWFEGLSEELQQIGMTEGYDALTKALEEEFQRENIELPDGTWVPVEWFKELSPELQKIAIEQGYDAAIKEFEATHVWIPTIGSAIDPETR